MRGKGMRMNASRLPNDPPGDELPPLEPVPGPVTRERVERRWFGIPARFVLLCLACAGLGAAVGLFATSSWAWGVVALLLSAIFFAALTEAVRQGRRLLPEQPGRLAADRRAQAVTAAEVLRARAGTSVARWRIRSRIDQLELARPAALQALGDAVRRADKDAQKAAQQRLDELDEERQRLETELDQELSGAEERIRRARLPVQETMMVAPNEPSAPYPPPDEGDAPQPATVPEPYPPPDEGTPPTPAPDPGQDQPG
jgi:hypothetical protein